MKVCYNANDSPSPAKQAQKIVTTLQQKTLSAPVNGLFGEDDDEEDTLHQIKKKIKPFEITREVNNTYEIKPKIIRLSKFCRIASIH